MCAVALNESYDLCFKMENYDFIGVRCTAIECYVGLHKHYAAGAHKMEICRDVCVDDVEQLLTFFRGNIRNLPRLREMAKLNWPASKTPNNDVVNKHCFFCTSSHHQKTFI